MIHALPVRLWLLISVLMVTNLCLGQTTTETLSYQDLKHRHNKIIRTYCDYAETLWVPAPLGGYWGDGIAAKNANGAVRGSLNTLLGYAWLAHEIKANPAEHSGLDRQHLIERIQQNLRYLAAHHISAEKKVDPVWGNSWQSSLWLGAGGIGAMLVWDDLDPSDHKIVRRMAAFEADKLSREKPKTAKPGDTGAEENGWNTNVLALAVALHDDGTSVPVWSEALRSYAINTLCRPSDSTSDKQVGKFKLRDIAFANSLEEDFSCVNHHFFHPDYLQVSIQHMGESLSTLRLGDKVFKTSKAPAFEPFFKHNVQEAWDAALSPLLLDTGEFLFPQGNDWTYHCTTNQGSLCFVAAEFNNPEARQAAHRAVAHVERRSALGPPGRILGDTNLQWWWEPLVVKRMITGMLAVELPGRVWKDAAPALDLPTLSQAWDAVDVWLYRNDKYVVSVSGRKPFMTTFTPLGLKTDYWTLPAAGGILNSPFKNPQEIKMGDAVCYVGENTSSGLSAVIALPESAVFVTTEKLGPITIENDTLTTPGRIIESRDFRSRQSPLSVAETDASSDSRFMLQSDKRFLKGGKTSATSSLMVDNSLIIESDQLLNYVGGTTWTGLSVAVERVTPSKDNQAWEIGFTTKAAYRTNLRKVGVNVWITRSDDSRPAYKIELHPDNPDQPILVTRTQPQGATN